MNRSPGHRRCRRHLAAAVVSVGLAGWAAPPADGGLVVDLRAIAATSGGAISADGKTIFLTRGTPVTFTISVFARIRGQNSVQEIGEFGGGNGDDRRNDDSVLNIAGSFQSVGGFLGNMTTGPAGAQVSPDPRVVPYNAAGSQNGIAQDWDSDGDLDIGTTGTALTNMWIARATSPARATVFNASTTAVKGWSDVAGTFGANSRDTIIDATTAEIQVGTIRWITSGINGPNILLNFVPRPTTDADSALWFEDGAAVGKTPGTGNFSIGAPVNLFDDFVPAEPSSVGLLGVLAAGLLARRRLN